MSHDPSTPDRPPTSPPVSRLGLILRLLLLVAWCVAVFVIAEYVAEEHMPSERATAPAQKHEIPDYFPEGEPLYLVKQSDPAQVRGLIIKVFSSRPQDGTLAQLEAASYLKNKLGRVSPAPGDVRSNHGRIELDCERRDVGGDSLRYETWRCLLPAGVSYNHDFISTVMVRFVTGSGTPWEYFIGPGEQRWR